MFLCKLVGVEEEVATQNCRFTAIFWRPATPVLTVEVRLARRQNLKLAWEDAWNLGGMKLSKVIIAQIC